MKYFQMTAYTPYCGEELTSYEMAESEEEWDEYYREGSGVEIIEITKQSYEDYKDSGY